MAYPPFVQGIQIRDLVTSIVGTPPFQTRRATKYVAYSWRVVSPSSPPNLTSSLHELMRIRHHISRAIQKFHVATDLHIHGGDCLRVQVHFPSTYNKICATIRLRKKYIKDKAVKDCKITAIRKHPPKG